MRHRSQGSGISSRDGVQQLARGLADEADDELCGGGEGLLPLLRLRSMGGASTGLCSSVDTLADEVAASVFAFFNGGSEGDSKETAGMAAVMSVSSDKVVIGEM